MRFKRFDFVLISVIVVSGCYLTYRLVTSQRSKTAVVSGAATPPPQLYSQIQVEPQTLPTYSEPLQTTFRRVSPATLRQLESKGARSLDKTPLCMLGFKPTAYVAISRGDFVQALVNQNVNVLGDRFPRCYEVGSKVTMLLFDRGDLNAPFAKTFATATVVDILETPVRLLPDEVFAGIGMTREEHAKFVKLDSETIVVFDQPKPAESSSRDNFPPIFPGAGILNRSQLRSIQLVLPELAIIDVRTPAEFAKGTLNGATNIPVRLDADVMKSGPWVTSRRSLIEKVEYDRDLLKKTLANPRPTNPPQAPAHLAGALNSIRKKTQGKGASVVVVGTNSGDVRAMALMLELQKLGIQKVFWYLD